MVEKLLEEGHVIRVKPKGYSMYPLFVPGRDEAVIQKSDIAQLRRGDVILYRRKKSILVLHRIWKREGNQFYLVGDNQTEIEGPVEAAQIRGRLTGLFRKGRYISVRHPVYRMYSRIWLLLRPFRAGISGWIHKIKQIMAKKNIKE